MRLSRDDLRGEVTLVATLRLDGREWRRASTAIELADGERLDAGLMLDEVPCEGDPDQALTEERQVALGLHAETDWAEVATLLALSFAGVQVEVAMVATSRTWAQREVLLVGLPSAVSYAGGQLLELTVAEELLSDTALLPAAGQVVGAATWHTPTSGEADAVAEEAVGVGYPIVFGAPGVPESEDDAEGLPAWPVVVVDARHPFLSNASADVRVLVAGHASGLSTVRLLNVDRHEGAQLWYCDGAAMTASTDLALQPVTTATIQASGSVSDPDYLPWEGGHALYAQALADGESGVLGPSQVGSAASIVAWLLDRSSLRSARIGDPRTLRGLRFDFWASEARAPSQIAVEDVLAWCGASLVPGPEGLELVEWDAQPSALDVEATIGPEFGCSPAGPLTITGLDQVATAVEVRYGPLADTGDYARRLVIGPTAAVGTPGPRAVVDPLAELASARWGVRWAAPLELPTVWRTATALELARRWLRMRALPVVTIDYLVPQELQVLRPGSVVAVEDPERGLTGVRAWILSMPRGAGPRLAKLRVLPQPEVPWQ